MDSVDEIKLEFTTIKIYREEEDSENPRQWSNLGKMVCFHGRYDLGDKNHGFNEPYDFVHYLESNQEHIIMLPLYLYDHSGISHVYLTFIFIFIVLLSD